MLALTIRSDNPQAEIAIYQDAERIAEHIWQADRHLAETLHAEITHLLDAREIALNDVDSIIVYEGPGSFTGLRIGIAVANGLAYSLAIPIVGVGGDSWEQTGLNRLENGENDQQVVPFYGADPNITIQKK